MMLTDLSTNHNISSMELGAHIRHHRQAAHLSLRKLAELIGVNPAYLSRVERGIVPPSDTLIQAIATALGREPEEFLLLAGRLPVHWQQAIAASPARGIELFRRALGDCIAEPSTPYGRTVLTFGGTRAIEEAGFPFETLSDIAELESWRKEIYRPIYHLHKWWAQRLGSVFRAFSWPPLLLKAPVSSKCSTNQRACLARSSLTLLWAVAPLLVKPSSWVPVLLGEISILWRILWSVTLWVFTGAAKLSRPFGL
jgi:transcriptional regulator with XRE-family HTH domain